MRLTWDDAGSRFYEAGVDRGVFFPKTGPGVPWNGLTSVKESVEGDGAVVTYIDGQKIINQVELGQFAADISAITYPDEMYPYDGFQRLLSGQTQPLFNLSYRSLIGNDIEGMSYGYRLHLIFNCLLTPTIRANETLNASSDISDFEWKLTTTPVANPYTRPSSHFFIESNNVEAGALAAIENMLYGQSGIDPAFPTIQQLVSIFEANAIFIVTDNGDGTATFTGPAGWVDQDGIDPSQWHLTSPSVTPVDENTYLTRSY